MTEPCHDHFLHTLPGPSIVTLTGLSRLIPCEVCRWVGHGLCYTGSSTSVHSDVIHSVADTYSPFSVQSVWWYLLHLSSLSHGLHPSLQNKPLYRLGRNQSYSGHPDTE